jgi:hypothetical protein
MTHLWSRLQVFGAMAIAAGLIWGSGMLASALPQSERLPAAAHAVRGLDYATDAIAPGSRFARSRPTYDQ